MTDWDGFADVVAPVARRFYRAESRSRVIRSCEPMIIPALLQTQEYAREILRGVHGLPEERVPRHLEVLRERQWVLERAEPPQMRMLIGEAALRQQVGGPQVMRRQMEHLRRLASRDGISVRVMSRVGANPAMLGPFTILETGGCRMKYVEYQGDCVFRSGGDALTESFEAIFDQATDLA